MISPKFLDECRKAKGFLYRGSEKVIQDYMISNRYDISREPYMNMKLYKWFNNAFNKKFGWKVRDGIFTTGDECHTTQFGNSYLFFPLDNNYKFVWSPEIKDLNFNDFIADINDSDEELSSEKLDKLHELVLIVTEYKDRDLDDAIRSGHEVIFNCKKFLYVNKKWEFLCKGLI